MGERYRVINRGGGKEGRREGGKEGRREKGCLCGRIRNLSGAKGRKEGRKG